MRRGALLLARHHTGGEVETPTEATFGTTTIGAGKSQLGPERERVWAANLTEEAFVAELKMYLEPSGVPGEQKVKAIIYSNNKGAPETLVAEGSEVIFKSSEPAGWYVLPFPEIVGLEPAVWWIGVMNGNPTEDVIGYRFETVAASRHYKNRTYTEKAAAAFGAATVDSEQASIYAPYRLGSVPGPPVNLTAPSIGGTPQEGFTLTAANGTWSRSPTGVAHQWLRCDTSGSAPAVIAGATGQTYGVVKADVGHTIRVQETATNGAGPSAPASSVQTAVVTATSSAIKYSPMLGLNGSPYSEEPLNYNTVSLLGVKGARAEFSIGEGTARLIKACETMRARGCLIQPLAGAGNRIPSAAEAKGLAAWCTAVPEIKIIEFQNETNYTYQLGPNKEAGELYAVRVKEAAEACGPHGVGILAQASDAGTNNEAWIEGMFKAVPNLASFVSGWVIHPYSGAKTEAEKDTFGIPMMERMLASLAKHGDTTKPIDITEWGFTSANGVVLSDGKHYTYAEAAKMLSAHAASLRALCKGRLRSHCYYQAHNQQAVGAGTNREWFFGSIQNNSSLKEPFTAAVKTFMAE